MQVFMVLRRLKFVFSAEPVIGRNSFLRLSAVVMKSKLCEDFAKRAEISGIVPSS
jgi:hypothetical protein